MKGSIEGGDSEGCGLEVVDNNGVEHWIEIKYAPNDISYHEQEGYPDDSNERTAEQTEHGHQAYRYAKWHVYRERGYNTLPRYENPDSIVGAMLALDTLSDDAFIEQFGDLIDRVRRHATGGSVKLPFDDADPDAIVVYRQDIYLQPDPLDETPPLVEQFTDYFSDPSTTIQKLLGEDGESSERLVEILAGEAEPAETLPAFDIEAVSDLHYLHSDGVTEQTHWSDQPLDRDPDARIELLPVNPDVFPTHKQFLFSHLGNQVRDYTGRRNP